MREFQAEYRGKGPPNVHVRITAKLVKLPERNIIGATDSDALVPAQGPDLDDVVHAFDAAAGKTLKRIVEWTLITGARHQP